MSTFEKLHKYRMEYTRYLKRKAFDPMVTEPDRNQFLAEHQRFVDQIRQKVEDEHRKLQERLK